MAYDRFFRASSISDRRRSPFGDQQATRQRKAKTAGRGGEERGKRDSLFEYGGRKYSGLSRRFCQKIPLRQDRHNAAPGSQGIGSHPARASGGKTPSRRCRRRFRLIRRTSKGGRHGSLVTAGEKV